MCVLKIFSEITGPTEAKLHVEPPWDKGGKLIQMVMVICCSSFLYCQPPGCGGLLAGILPKIWPCSTGLWKSKYQKPRYYPVQGDWGYKWLVHSYWFWYCQVIVQDKLSPVTPSKAPLCIWYSRCYISVWTFSKVNDCKGYVPHSKPHPRVNRLLVCWKVKLWIILSFPKV